MVNKPLIRPYFLGGVALGGGTARIPTQLITIINWSFPTKSELVEVELSSPEVFHCKQLPLKSYPPEV